MNMSRLPQGYASFDGAMRKEHEVSEMATGTAGTIAWFEIPAEDTERARNFYGRLFGWQFQPFDGEDYHMTYEGGGAIVKARVEAGPTVYFGTVDIDAAIARVRDLGGEAAEKQEIAGVGSYAQCTDTEGNPFGLYQHGGDA